MGELVDMGELVNVGVANVAVTGKSLISTSFAVAVLTGTALLATGLTTADDHALNSDASTRWGGLLIVLVPLLGEVLTPALLRQVFDVDARIIGAGAETVVDLQPAS